MNSLPFLTRLIAEVTYLRAEIAYLREQLPAGTALRFTDRWRKRLARAGVGVGWKRLAEIATVGQGLDDPRVASTHAEGRTGGAARQGWPTPGGGGN